MTSLRISASSYSNTAPLVWSFLYGANHGKVEIILDNAPARSAELLAQDRVDAALVPVIASQFIDGVKLIPDVCVGARDRVRSVCLVTKGVDLKNVKTVALDVSSKTSVVLTKIIFREFLGFEPVWRDAKPDVTAMLAESDAALLIGDPALSIEDRGLRIADLSHSEKLGQPLNLELNRPSTHLKSAIRNPQSAVKIFDLAQVWNHHTGLGFVFAMWMTRKDKCSIDFASARDEGLAHLNEIVANYETDIPLGRKEMHEYLSQNISYAIDDSMRQGMELFFALAAKNGLTDENKECRFLT